MHAKVCEIAAAETEVRRQQKNAELPSVDLAVFANTRKIKADGSAQIPDDRRPGSRESAIQALYPAAWITTDLKKTSELLEAHKAVRREEKEVIAQQDRDKVEQVFSEGDPNISYISERTRATCDVIRSIQHAGDPMDADAENNVHSDSGKKRKADALPQKKKKVKKPKKAKKIDDSCAVTERAITNLLPVKPDKAFIKLLEESLRPPEPLKCSICKDKSPHTWGSSLEDRLDGKPCKKWPLACHKFVSQCLVPYKTIVEQYAVQANDAFTVDSDAQDTLFSVANYGRLTRLSGKSEDYPVGNTRNKILKMRDAAEESTVTFLVETFRKGTEDTVVPHQFLVEVHGEELARDLEDFYFITHVHTTTFIRLTSDESGKLSVKKTAKEVFKEANKRGARLIKRQEKLLLAVHERVGV